MFDKLEDLLIRFEELMSELSEPDVANDPVRFRKLMKEQSDLPFSKNLQIFLLLFPWYRSRKETAGKICASAHRWSS